MKAPSLEKEEIETIFHYLENRVIELSKKVEFAEYERAQAVIMRNLYEQLLKRWKEE